MNKLVSFLIIVMFLFSFIPVNVTLVSAQTSNVCCLKNLNGEYCSYTSADNCDLTFDTENKLPLKQSSFACSQVSVCNEPICCVNAEGTCSEKVSRAQCIGQGGTPTSSNSCSAASQCQTGACIINGQCSFPMTQKECELAEEEENAETTFDSSITSLEQCIEKNSLQEGCCVVQDSTCRRTTASECSQISGDFRGGTLCSNPDLAGVCPGIKKETTKQCFNEDVYLVDSKGNKENVAGVNYDGFIHDSESDKIGKVGNCDFSFGTVCGEDNSGQKACIDINCKVGDTFVANGFVQYSFEEGSSTPERIAITNDDLGEREIRYNGESWCMTNTGVDPNPPGTTHYIYSCQLGKVEVSPLGTFRNTICESQIKERVIDGNNVEYENAVRVDNKWDQCSKCGDGKWKKCGRNECLKLGGSLDTEKSQCVYNTGGINECWPKYPPGIDFIGDLTGIPNSKHTFENTCGICGKGSNSCDRTECSYLVDCGNFKEGLSVTEGVLVGAPIGAITAVGAYHFGPGYIKEALSIGFYKAPIAAGAKVSLEKTGTFVAKEAIEWFLPQYLLGKVLGEQGGNKVYQKEGNYYMTGKDTEGNDVVYTAEKQ